MKMEDVVQLIGKRRAGVSDGVKVSLTPTLFCAKSEK
jgi:hypothetical protein